MNWMIPLFEPDLTEADLAAAMKPLEQRWLTMGDATRRFEDAFAEMLEVPHAIAVGSGTAALHLSLMALGVGEGDEVLLPSLTFVACANVIRAMGATPVFVDIASEHDWTVSPDDLKAKSTPRTKAIMVVHYSGVPCAMDAIKAVADEKSIAVIEDCAHALVSRHHGRWCGTWGAAGCFSFFSNKNLTTGEGGMVTCVDEEIAARVRHLRSHGMTTLTLDRHRGRAISYDVTDVGLNYRIDEIRSALGYSQLPRLQENLQRRREVHAAYVEQLREWDGIVVPFRHRPMEEIGVHIFPIALPAGCDRDAVIARMKDAGIQTSIHYPLIHQFSAYRHMAASTPLAEALAPRILTLPFYPAMTADDVGRVCSTLRRATG